jgi:hypothetical protein
VLELLTTLCKYTQRDKSKFYSTADLMGISSLSTESQHNTGFNSLSIESPSKVLYHSLYIFTLVIF